jgi:hypothetical protein
MKFITNRSLLAALWLLISGCGWWSIDTYWRSERYMLIAVDTLGQMSLSFDRGNGTGLGLVGPTVFSIGANDKYIVLAQHPATDLFGGFDRSITNYYIVERTQSSDFEERQKRVRGPMTKSEFDSVSAKLSLPKFTKTFKDLE